MAPIKMPDLGRLMALGELYDAQTDRNLGITLWPPDEIQNHTIEVQGTKADFSLKLTNSISDTAKSLNIDADLKLSLLANLISLKGGFEFLNQNSRKTSESSLSVVGSKITKRRFIRFNELQCQNQRNNQATHVVTEIRYGGYCVCRCIEESNKQHRSCKGKAKASGECTPSSIVQGLPPFQQVADKLIGTMGADCNFSGESRQDWQNRNIKYDLFCEGMTIDPPTTFEEAINSVKRATESNDNNNTEVPVIVILQPLQMFSDNVAIKYFRVAENADEEIIDNIEKYFECVSELQSGSHRLDSWISKYRHIFPSLSSEIRNAKTSIDNFFLTQRQELRKLLMNYRANGDMDSLQQFISSNGQLSAKKAELDEMTRRWEYPQQLMQEAEEQGFPFVSPSSIRFSRNVVICAFPHKFNEQRAYQAIGEMEVMKKRFQTSQCVSIYLDPSNQEEHRSIHLSIVENICFLQRNNDSTFSRISAVSPSSPSQAPSHLSGVDPSIQANESQRVCSEPRSSFWNSFKLTVCILLSSSADYYLPSIVQFLYGIHSSDLSHACYDQLVPLVTPIWYQIRDISHPTPDWQWSPGKGVWMPVTVMVVSGGFWQGQKPAPANQLIILYLKHHGQRNQKNVSRDAIDGRLRGLLPLLQDP